MRAQDWQKRSPGNLPKDIARVLHYWRSSLVDSHRIEISGTEIKGLGVDLSFEDVLLGRCPKNTADNLRRKQQQKKEDVESSPRFANTNRDILQVLICPLSLLWSADFDPRDLGMPRFIDPFWIPADLTTEGELLPPRGRVPWIPRRMLESGDEDTGFVVGTVDDLEQFVTKNPPSAFESWKDYWAWSDRLFKAVCKSSIADYRLPDYDRRKNPRIMTDVTSQGAKKQLINLYYQVLEGIRKPGLLASLATLKEPRPAHLKPTVSALRRGTLRHFGEFGYTYPLSPSQRNAVHQALLTPEGQVLAITGPPGTGKTTILQSIIASTWVNATRSKGGMPPIIVACAGTNQAVTNIVTAFDRAVTRPGPLAGRWLPKISSYGRYCPAASQSENAIGLHVEHTNGEGLSRDMECWEYVHEAKKFYLERASQFLGLKVDVARAARFLQKLIGKELSSIYGQVSLAADQGMWAWVQVLLGLRPGVSYEDFRQALEGVDCSHRHTAFQLATHYWEARWLLATEALLKESKRSTGRYRDQRAWQRSAMVTPCFVATLATAPRFFADLASKNTPLIDLLIIDEASQISAEEGAACFCLAKRAVVVGDPQQLEPVREIPPHVDVDNLMRHEVIRRATEDELKPVMAKGMTASQGSLMSLAIAMSPVIDNNMRGMFLAEHRRCLPEIIQYCNELAYLGRLIPFERKIETPILPPLGYAHIPGVSSMVGTSRENKIEANTIAAWLTENQALIEEAYKGERLENLVAILTPFFAQKRRLEQNLRKNYPAMTIGTVHGLQGAERAIVLFSPVYHQGEIKGTYFFDRGVQMLNVSVSRARDSFLVFGDMGIFNPILKTPSGILAKYLFREASNELTNIPVPPIAGFKNEQIERLTTLGDHQRVLQEAFLEAREEVMIVSPTISSHAIDADNIPDLIRQACARGVKVSIFIDRNLNTDSTTNKFKEPAANGCTLVENAGAELTIVQGIHNKTLAIDNSILVEGSFNWLSAVRNIRSRHQKQENSFKYSGPKAEDYIKYSKEVLAYRAER